MKTNQLITSATLLRCTKNFQPWLGKLAVLAAVVFPLVSTSAADFYWGCTNATGVSSNWTVGTSWVGGAVPTGADNAIVLSTNGGFSIVVNVSTNIQDFTINRAPVVGSAGSGTDETASTAITNLIAAGQTLSVLGQNGFFVQHYPSNKMTSFLTISGNALLVSNSAASFVLNSGQSGVNNASKNQTVNMAGLTNLTVYTAFFAAANPNLGKVAGGGFGAQCVKVTLARTNIITAIYTNDYTALDFTNAIEIGRQDYSDGTAANFAANSFFQLGFSNAFYADSFGVGRGNASGNTVSMTLGSLNLAGANPVGFNVSFANSNSAAPTSSAFFRNTNGVDRMSLLAVGVDAGTSLTNSRNNGILYLIGGKIDMKVNQIWLGRNRTNAVGNSDMGGFAFDNGTVDANTMIAGYMKFTNVAACGGFIVVGTNGVLKVNNSLTLGQTPNDPSAAWATAQANTVGQLQINGGGTVMANQINVGGLSTNDQITVNAGGLLMVSNTIAASPTNALYKLTLNGGNNLTLFVTAGATNAFVTNLVTTATAAIINIGSFSGVAPSTNVLINYQTIVAHNVTIGSIPPGFNNMQIQDDGVGNILLIVQTNAQKNLVWRGTQDSNWNHSSTNWLDTNSLNIVKFTDNDKVIFDDSSSVPTISVAEAVNPGALTVSNKVNQFVFSSGGGSIGGVTLNKNGTNSVEVDCSSSLAVQVNQGSLLGNGTVSSVNIASGASMNFAGTVSSSLTDSGNATLGFGGVVNGAATVQTGATLSNAGTLNGSLSMSSGSIVNNSGLMSAIGSPTIPTNSVFNNSGTIYGGTLTIALGGTLADTATGTTGGSPGSINVASLLVNGTFKPGGNSINTTKVTDYSWNGGSPSVLGTPNGRVNLNVGSTTILQVNVGGTAPTNTFLLSENQGFGASANFKSFGGGTLVITNAGAAYAAGQSFQFFGLYYDGSDNLTAGLNTTNTYPVIQPAVPGPGLKWELDQLIPHGIIRVVSASDPSLFFSLTNSITPNPANTNVITQLTWPTNQMGGWLQQLSTTISNGLSATNWISLNGNYGATNDGIQIMSNTNVWNITNTLVTDPTLPGSAIFFRFVYP